MPVQYRQGDVLLCRVNKLRTRSEPLPAEAGRVVVAEGAQSGHAHALAPERARLLRRGRLLRVGAGGAALEHEEHAPILLPEGDYQICRQREYDPRLAPGGRLMREVPLTPEERARLPELIERWTRIGLSAQPVERGAAEQAIIALYGWAGLPEPSSCGRPAR